MLPVAGIYVDHAPPKMRDKMKVHLINVYLMYILRNSRLCAWIPEVVICSWNEFFAHVQSDHVTISEVTAAFPSIAAPDVS